MTRLGGLLIAAMIAAPVLVGCGGGGAGEHDVAQVKQTFKRETTALADGDGTTACSLTTPSGRALLERAAPGKACEQIVVFIAQHLLTAEKEGLRSVQIKRVTIDGDTATVRDADLTSTRGTIRGFFGQGSGSTVLKKQPGGSWKIAG